MGSEFVGDSEEKTRSDVYVNPNPQYGQWSHIHADDWNIHNHPAGLPCDEREVDDIACPICHQSMHQHTIHTEVVVVNMRKGRVATGWDCPAFGQVVWENG